MPKILSDFLSSISSGVPVKLARLAVSGLVIGSLFAVDSMAFADPDAVRAAKERLDALSAEVSSIEQEGIEAGAKAEEAKVELERAQEDLRAQQEKVSQLADEIGATAVLQMQQGSLDMTMQLLSSATDAHFLSSLATIQSEQDRSNALMQQLQNDQARLDVLEGKAAAAKAEMDANLAKHKEKLAEYEAKQREAEQVYDRLNKEEQERLRKLREEAEWQARERAEAQASEEAAREQAAGAASRDQVRETRSEPSQRSGSQSKRDTPAPAPAPNASRAQTVINAALAQVGKTYRHGATGPNAFDCSGLTTYAYRQVGISLPRTSRAQYSGAGRKVSVKDIQPGDLVFYYGGPSHVGIYIGGGKIVHAANPRSGINVTGLYSMPLTGVRRVL